MDVRNVGTPQRITATTQLVATGTSGHLVGFYVGSTTAGTIVLRNGDGSGTQISGTITPAVGYHAFPAEFTNGLHATVGGTLDVTFFYK